MTFIPTPNGARVVINWAKGSEQFGYVWYATRAGFDSSNLAALANAVDAVHTATVKGYFSANVSYVNTTAYDARTVDGEIVVDNSSAGAGTVGTEAMPLNTAVCVTIYTDARGRSARGRKYISGFAENAVTQGEFTQTAITNAAAYCNAIIQAMLGVGWSPVIRSTQENKQVVDPANTRAIASILVRNAKVATQRRRVDRP